MAEAIQTAAGIAGQRVLITGGAGFIGRHLVDAVARDAAEVRIFDDLSTGQRPEALASNVRLIVGDIRDAEALRAAAVGVDLVIHLAAAVGMQRAHARADEAYDISDRGTATVLAETGRTPVVLMSSSAVYGLETVGLADERTPLDESAALHYDAGKQGYACGKQRVEVLGQAARADGRAVMIVRPFNVVGPGQVGTYGMVLPRFIAQARAGEALTIFGSGSQTRSFGAVWTFVEVLTKLIERPEAWAADATPVNIGTDTETSVLRLAEIVRSACGSSSPLAFRPYESIYPGKRDVQSRRPDLRRLEALIGRVEWPDLETVVRRMLALARDASMATVTPASV